MVSPVRLSVPTTDDMHALGFDLGRLVQAGDLVILDGELGAGKTQLAQGIGQAMGVSGQVVSPTFVLARVHPSTSGGPALIHVDAYRLNGFDELDDLDLESSMPDAVTVVEWGKPVAEGLSVNRLEITADPMDDTRDVTVTPIGSRWASLLSDWEQLVNDDMGRDAQKDAEGTTDD